jgi:hypothetical protein
MIANEHRGEVAANLDGQDYRLCLTLGALAELEVAYRAENLNALVERFSTGKLSATDLIRVIGAGLRGAGHEVSDGQVGAMHCEGGAAGFAKIVAELLAVTFGRPAAGEVGHAVEGGQPNP